MHTEEIICNLPEFITSEGLLVHKKYEGFKADAMAHMLGDILIYGNGVGLVALSTAYPDRELINRLVNGIDYLTRDGYPHRTWIKDMSNLTPEIIEDEMWYNFTPDLDIGFRGDTSYSQFAGCVIGLLFASMIGIPRAKDLIYKILKRFWKDKGVLINLEGEQNPHSHWLWIGSNGLVVLTLHFISEWLGIKSELWNSTLWLLKQNGKYLHKIHKSETAQDSINLCFLCFLALRQIRNLYYENVHRLHNNISHTNPFFDLVVGDKKTWESAYLNTSLFTESDYLWKDITKNNILNYQYNSRVDLLLLKGLAQ